MSNINKNLNIYFSYFWIERRHICRAVSKTFKEREANTVIGSGNVLFYDLKRILYATKKLNVTKVSKFEF